MKSLDSLKKFNALKITLAGPEEILSWSHGEVTKPETINYRTFRAEKDGLFCEKIFGPTKDFECYCGKYKRARYKGVICDKCGVEVTYSRVRRERMGHIKLASPVAHVWFFRGIPSKMGILLNTSPRNLEAVIYFSSFIVTSFDKKKKTKALVSLEKNFFRGKKGLLEETEKEIKNFKQKLEREKKNLKIKDKTQKEIAIKEMERKVQRQIQAKREKLVSEQENLKNTFDQLKQILDGIERHSIISDREYLGLKKYIDSFSTVEIGAAAILKILEGLDLSKLALELRKKQEKAKGQKKVKLLKRLKVVEGFRRAKIDPSFLILKVIPVIPPDLRPMVQLEGGRFATSDLNDLYRRVINRNNRLKRLLELGAPKIIVRNERRMLQEAVDALLDSPRQKRRRPRRGKQELRSLSDMLKGKGGRFRQNLLGKRVDYSGRSVIVVGPKLRLSECGLPREMALELFKPFVLREILLAGLAPNIKNAKFVLESKIPEVWDILEKLVKDHPVLLNRAPTLHRLGIQAFYPKLIDGYAIQLHPCVCAGYNADFDGDQMAVHLPLSSKARKEANDIMLSSKNLLKPASGKPITIPNREMVMGIYFLTSIDKSFKKSKIILSCPQEAILAESLGKVNLRQPIEVRINRVRLETTVGRIIFNKVLPPSLRFFNEETNKSNDAVRILIEKCLSLEGIKRTVKLIDDLKDLGFAFATRSGISMSITDCKTLPLKDRIIAEANKKAAEIDQNFRRGLITKREKSRLAEELWMDTTNEIDDLTWESLSPSNSVKMLITSGCRGTRDQFKQIAGMRGLVADPTGKIVELPTRSNYHQGLTVFEYFSGARGSRKGLTDKALKTADAGYLTRRLVDVAQEVIIKEEDCGTLNGRIIRRENVATLASFAERITGRVAALGIKVGRKVLIKKGELITGKMANLLEKEEKIKEVLVRSSLTCEARYGVCAACYGEDPATAEKVKIGTPVGIMAAQSIGEPGTQLTMRTFHLGGVVGKDITQGLPRVEEIFEARTPKSLSIMSEITGRVKILKKSREQLIVVESTDKKAKMPRVEYEVDPAAEILVKTEDLVAKGEPLTGGYLDLGELLNTVGVRETQEYIVNEIQRVYSSQGVSLNDKHLEVITRQMFSKVKIESSGDTNFLPGEIVTRYAFEEENEKILAEGGEPATAKIILLGVTRASLETDSFLAAASFIETARVLTNAATSGKVDRLLGLKENVIIGRLIPVGERAKLN